MAGKHAAPGQSEFLRGFSLMILKIVAAFALAGLVGYVAFTQVGNWFPSNDSAPLTLPAATDSGDTTTTSTEAAPQPVRTTSTVGAPADSTTTTAPNGSSTTTTAPSTTTTTSTSTTSTTTTTVNSSARPPSEVSVRVLNSTTTKGLAAGLTADLAALGYQMEEQDNYRPTLADTFIYYAPGNLAEGQAMLANVPGAVVAENPASDPSADLLIILGTSYSG